MSFIEDFKGVFRKSENGLVRLIVINVLVFVIANVVDLFGDYFSSLFSLPFELNVFISRFWSLFTYMFLHKELFHILFNMLWLYWMGKIFVDFMGSKRLVAVYLLGGVCGGLMFLLLGNLLWGNRTSVYLMGASASVMAVVIAIAVIVPNYVIHLMFFGPVRIKYIALVSFILTSVIDLNDNTGGKIAHIGGALFGLLYAVLYKRGTDLSAIITSFSKVFSAKGKMKVAYKRSATDEDYNASKIQLQHKIDEILDKISKSGYESLSKEEKEILFKVSNQK